MLDEAAVKYIIKQRKGSEAFKKVTITFKVILVSYYYFYVY